jgi:hypothetical protein
MEDGISEVTGDRIADDAITPNHVAPTTMQRGSFAVAPIAAGSSNNTTVTFPVAFTSTPTVVASISNTDTRNIQVKVTEQSTTSCRFYIYNHSATATTVNYTVHWIAVGV